jgi:hypothetical protein
VRGSFQVIHPIAHVVPLLENEADLALIIVCLRVFIIRCGICMLAAFWGTLFQLVVYTFNWIDQVIEK